MVPRELGLTPVPKKAAYREATELSRSAIHKRLGPGCAGAAVENTDVGPWPRLPGPELAVTDTGTSRYADGVAARRHGLPIR